MFVSAHSTVILFGAVFGISYLATVVATTAWVNTVLPADARGLVLGVMWGVHMLAVAVSSQLGAVLADAQNGYDVPIVASVLLTAVAAMAVHRQPDPNRSAVEAELPVA
jgi:predicted MFS family arabinose efflux permease